jgi:hypothetical protein
MKKNFYICIGIIIFIGGCFLFYNQINLSRNTTKLDPQNGTYIIEGQSVTLVHGNATQEIVPGSASKTITKYFGNEAIGDINGNGTNDVAFLLTQETGGSGTFYYLAVLLDNNTGTNAILLGDRIAPESTEIKDGKIIVNYADRKPEDPMTVSPFIGISRYFLVNNTTLQETGK